MKKKLFRFHPAFPIHDESRLATVFERFPADLKISPPAFCFLEGPWQFYWKLGWSAFCGGGPTASALQSVEAQSGIGVVRDWCYTAVWEGCQVLVQVVPVTAFVHWATEESM